MTKHPYLIYHFFAFIIVAIWGSTFVFTKMLLTSGLSPANIFTLRFIIAYLLLLLFDFFVKWRSHRRFQWLSHSPKEELVMAGLGLTGGSLYFLSENAAMLFTTATNTSLIVCSCPLFTMLAMYLVYRDEPISKRQVLGSLLACAGMCVVVLNGHFVLHLSPLGDLLAFTACICWAFYSLLIRHATKRHSTLFITRKVFFYGLVTILPYYMFVPDLPSLHLLTRPHVIYNLLFLGCLASMVCFVVWNWVIRHLGAVDATNWVYFNPITTMVFASWLLGEPITTYFLLGMVMVLTGMYLADSHRKTKENTTI